MLTVDLARAGVREGTRVLDLGAGQGRHGLACLKAGAPVLLADLDFASLAGARDLAVAMRAAGEIPSDLSSPACAADATRLPFSDASFDLVIASEVLEHVVADSLAFSEIARVLRPGGTLALSVPRAWPEALNWALSREYRATPGGHVRIYRRRQLLARATAARLAFRGSHHRHALHSPYWWLRCAVGLHDEQHRLVAAYHRLLVWDIMAKPASTRILEVLLNPLLGKSLVAYFERV